MGALLSDPKLWVAAIGLITVIVGVYQHFLSKKARLKREQKKISEDDAQEEREDVRGASSETASVNESIKKQGESADDWFDKPTRESKPTPPTHD